MRTVVSPASIQSMMSFLRKYIAKAQLHPVFHPIFMVSTIEIKKTTLNKFSTKSGDTTKIILRQRVIYLFKLLNRPSTLGKIGAQAWCPISKCKIQIRYE